MQDGLKKASGPMAKYRAVCVEARTPKINEKLRQKAKKVSILDNDTRWGPQFLMLDRMIELRPHLQDMADCGNSKLHLSEYEWNQAIGLRDLLKHAYKVTKELQFADLTSGTFYKKWTELRLIVKNQGNVEGIPKSMKAERSCSSRTGYSWRVFWSTFRILPSSRQNMRTWP